MNNNDCNPAATTMPAEHTALETLDERLVELASHLNAATCRWLRLVAEMDRHPGKGSWGLKSTAHYLNWRCGVAMGTAREHVRVARAIEELPGISAAFAEGRLSYSKVRAMTRVATPANEAYFIGLATQASAEQVEVLAREYRQVRLTEGMDERRAPMRRRNLRYRWDDDGMLVFSGRLPAEEGALLVEALRAGVDAIEREASGEGAASTEVDAGAQGGASVQENVPAELATPDPYDHRHAEYSNGARRADAMLRLVQGYLGGDDVALPGADRYQVVLHVSADAFHEDGLVTRRALQDGPGLTREAARRAACDCSTVTVVESNDGTPLDIGRKTRRISPALRRALRARDRGCRFPSCTSKHYTDAHHVKHWADGGETKLANLVTLCSFHHALVHGGGFTVAPDDSGAFEFQGPGGWVIANAPLPPRGNVEVIALADSAIADNARNGTPVGEPMDHELAIAALVRKDVVPITPTPLRILAPVD